jgi:hypothetical protein
MTPPPSGPANAAGSRRQDHSQHQDTGDTNPALLA